ncbi:MAG: response regulator, partial [Chloroflexi bacterium]
MVQPILVVDDDSKIVQLVRAYLEREGYPVVTASDGRAALAAIEQHAPGLIVLDLMLPELDGMTVARRVRE